MGPKTSAEVAPEELKTHVAEGEMVASGRGEYLISIALPLMWVPIGDLNACSRCSWDWFRTTCSKELWQYLCRRDYPKAIPSCLRTYQAKKLNLTGVPKIDEFLLKNRLTYPKGRQHVDDARGYWMRSRNDSYLETQLASIKLRQSVHEGDRSDPKLVEIDKMKRDKHFTYPNHMKDLEKLEHDYLYYGNYTYSYSVKRMERKEDIFNGKKVDKEAITKEKLQEKAEAGKFTYAGWRSDVEKVKGYDSHYSINAEIKLMKKKQCFHENGVLPDKRLEKVKKKLKYPGWQQDYDNAMKHLISSTYASSDSHKKYMKRKQAAFENDRSDKRLVELDKLKTTLNYPDSEKDLREAEHAYFNPVGAYPDFESRVTRMKRCACLHGDRSASDLQKLDEAYAKCTYPGKEQDLKKAEKSYLDTPYMSDQCLKELTSKQELFEAGLDYFNQIPDNSNRYSF